ncbi:MAG TPA: hypothetical protein VHX11_11565, partial [Acidobacteriaceae bacterium]|nr:hypothetical protein [Acidobacteriaceae bacterium]
MKQILHIFAKDTRRFWREISLSIALLAALVWFSPGIWNPVRLTRISPGSVTRFRYIGFAVNPTILLVLSWWLLISRIVLDEPLVGNRQFWLTRPYEWKKLLAAKTLFLICWIAVSYLLTEMLLLTEVGFNPMEHVPGLLAVLLFVIAVLLLPVFALTSLTSNFIQAALTVLGTMALVSWYAGT